MVKPMKESAIDLLHISECNLLFSFKDIKPEEVNERINPEFNSISWILGHCFSHFHMILCTTCQETNLLSEDATHYYRYGTTKQEIDSIETPMTFEELVDTYLDISTSGFSYLKQLDETHFGQVIFPEIDETLEKSVQRLSLHFLGHVGQIVLIRRALGNPGSSFVGGVQLKRRKTMMEEWTSWWQTSKRKFIV